MEPPFPESLCHKCLGLRPIRTERSVFLMCLRRPDKYPRQPVLVCAEYAPRDIEPR